MKPIQSNSDLAEYLVSLAQTLDEHHLTAQAGNLRVASQFLTGSASEFLHEAQSSLQDVMYVAEGLLSADDLRQVEYVIALINDAFTKVGGA